jgi:hypothetical protein
MQRDVCRSFGARLAQTYPVGLTPVTPFTEMAYMRAVGPIAREAPNATGSLWGVGWADMVEAHEWRGQGWRSAIRARHNFRRQIRDACGNERFGDVINAIACWGGVPPFAGDDVGALHSALRALPRLDAGEAKALDDLVGRRIASTSKLYAMSDPDRWVIYDSRVARALALLVSSIGPVDETRTRFPQPPGRVPGRSLSGFPLLAASATRQAALAFVYASWLARGIADELNRRVIPNPADVPWTALHVELALFTAGPLPLVNDEEGSNMAAGPAAAAATPAAKAAAVKTMQMLAAMGLADYGKNLGLTQAERQMAHRNAFRNAVRYSQQTKSLMVRLQFADGEQRYVVYKDDAPIAAFPPFYGDLNDALAFHDPDAMQKLTPEGALEKRRSARAKRTLKDKLPFLNRDEDSAGDDPKVQAGEGVHVTAAVLALPAGDPLGEDELLDDVFDDPDG